MKQIAVLGSTGSIGTSCLDVISAHPSRLNLFGMTAHRQWEQLAEQSNQFHPRFAVISDDSIRDEVNLDRFSEKTEVLFGEKGIEKLACFPEVEMVISGIVGAAGLRGTWAALEAGKSVGIANKETLVIAGPLIMDLAKKKQVNLIPVDSEHSAIFQALQSGNRDEVKKVVLTASGGPFRGYTKDQLNDVTPEKALNHPTWNMGPKITIDSATMMNKALEIIEAKWMFGLNADQIEVVIHPQSVVHSFVEFLDGSVIAQLSPPDMKLPIQYALSFPERWEGISPCIDWKELMTFEFIPPDREAFPSLELGFEVAERGGSCGAVLNAANEIAVERFLKQELEFNDIPRVCRAVLESHNFDPSPSLEELLKWDQWARQEIYKC